MGKRLRRQVGWPVFCSSRSGSLHIYFLGTTEDVDRFSRRTVKVTREHNEECRRLLKLMGIPVVVVRWKVVFVSRILIACQAPSEAEAQCAELARGGKVLNFEND